MNITHNHDNRSLAESYGDSASVPCLSEIVENLERVHLQLGLLEYRATTSDGAFSENAKRLFELAEEVKAVIEKLSITNSHA